MQNQINAQAVFTEMKLQLMGQDWLESEEGNQIKKILKNGKEIIIRVGGTTIDMLMTNSDNFTSMHVNDEQGSSRDLSETTIKAIEQFKYFEKSWLEKEAQ